MKDAPSVRLTFLVPSVLYAPGNKVRFVDPTQVRLAEPHLRIQAGSSRRMLVVTSGRSPSEAVPRPRVEGLSFGGLQEHSPSSGNRCDALTASGYDRGGIGTSGDNPDKFGGGDPRLGMRREGPTEAHRVAEGARRLTREKGVILGLDPTSGRPAPGRHAPNWGDRLRARGGVIRRRLNADIEIVPAKIPPTPTPRGAWLRA